MQMDAGLDTGAMLLKHAIAIAPDDTTQSLHDKLSLLGGQSIVEALRLLQQCQLTTVPQDESQASYAAKITKAEAEIDWRQDCATDQPDGTRVLIQAPVLILFFVIIC
jgi:methionyl-tRNA formyltransferase